MDRVIHNVNSARLILGTKGHKFVLKKSMTSQIPFFKVILEKDVKANLKVPN